ncbi:hepatic lectin-like [Kryptolebias marmoratus]|uniref:hepatic lectin-like n=1 Tax=Kryptolebias marmoratus TaxID=37003 RepID=UPI0018AD0073|nr:hepatic lectin-like [Kryptolebias marmoratus]
MQFLTDLFSGPKVVFYFSSKLRNWTEARSYCRERYTDLVIVTSDANNQVIKNLISSKVWIGLFRDSWKWEDGNNSSFAFWNNNEPNNNNSNENCAAANLGSSGKWEDRNCDEKKAFICHRAPFSKFVVKLNLKSSKDPNEVLEELQKKLIEKLKAQGVEGAVRLSWRNRSNGKIFKKKNEL